MQVTVDVPFDQILVAQLKEDIRGIMKDQKVLKARADIDGLAFYEMEDYMNNKKLLKHLKGVLRYYMVMEDFNEFVKEIYDVD